jgi:zinc transport system substrate-binding protein
MKKATCRISAALAALLLSQMPQQAGANTCDLTIGVSLHPYYSWVKNIVGGAAEVTTLIPPDVDPHSYQPTAADMVRLEGLDAVVVNGVGHDEFVTPMLKAIDNPTLTVIDTSKGLPLIPSFNDRHYAFEEQEGGGAAKVSYNSHTYIAVNGAIQQMQMISRELGKLCPEQSAEFTKNLRTYSATLRDLLAATLARIDGLKLDNLRIATVHDGYSYLFQELGIEVSAVVQPRHGVTPSSKQLQDTIKRIKQARVNVLFGEMDYEKKYVDIIFQETGCRLYALSHISNGEYSPEHFEETMKKNMDIIVQALTEVSGRGAADTAAAPAGMQEAIGRQMQDNAEQVRQNMQQNMQESVQKTVPEIQQKQMMESMGQQVQKVQESMQEKMQQAVPAVQQQNMQGSMTQQMQDTAKQMQEKMQQNMQNAVPQIQQKQMTESMGQQMQKVQESMQEKIQQAVPAVQQQNMQGSMTQQMQDTAKQMQEKMQQNMQNAVPKIQQKQMTESMGQQMQKVQESMQEKVQQTVPAVQQQNMQGSMTQQMQEKMQQAVPEIQQKQMSEQMQDSVQQNLPAAPAPATEPQAKP